MYTELIDGPIQGRNKNASIVHIEDINYESCDHERYTSLFQYGESIRNHFAVNGSVRGYRGEFYMSILWVDIDNYDVSEAFIQSLRSENPPRRYSEGSHKMPKLCFHGRLSIHAFATEP